MTSDQHSTASEATGCNTHLGNFAMHS